MSGERERRFNAKGDIGTDCTAQGFLSSPPSYRHGVGDHRSLYAWQEARAVALGAIDLARVSWKPYASALFSQLQRASLSVQLNIAEGYAYGNSPSFTHHLAIAYGSAVETASCWRSPWMRSSFRRRCEQAF